MNYLSPLRFDGSRYTRPISHEEMFFLCGIFNSFPVDFILRHKVATNLNIFYMMELPIPRFDKGNNLHLKLFENAARLVCTTKEYSDLLRDVKVNDPVTEPQKRLGLTAQINALSTKIYQLDRTELEFVLNNFSIVDENLKESTLDEFSMIE